MEPATIAIIGFRNERAALDQRISRGRLEGAQPCTRPGQRGCRSCLTAVRFDLGDRASYDPALAGVDVLALITPARPEQTTWETGLIAAAQRGGVEGIIKLSVIRADIAAPISFFARHAAQVEDVLRASGVPCIVLRANGFMQNLLRQRASIEAGSLVEPSGAAAASRVDVERAPLADNDEGRIGRLRVEFNRVGPRGNVDYAGAIIVTVGQPRISMGAIQARTLLPATRLTTRTPTIRSSAVFADAGSTHQCPLSEHEGRPTPGGTGGASAIALRPMAHASAAARMDPIKRICWNPIETGRQSKTSGPARVCLVLR